ncbi:F0F1 ATP synthase subunit A [Microgenomates group bacterium]|nr:F0F1 ATP synthase subunit A [Microgenomates group bacterium]
MINISLSPEVLFTIFGFGVTNSFFWQMVVTLLLLGMILGVMKKWQLIPNKLQVAVEMVVEWMLNSVSMMTGSRDKTKKLFPLVITLFFYILFCNLFSLMPALSAFSLRREQGEVPIFRTALADYGQVLVLTLLVVGLVQVLFITYQGIKPYMKQWFDFSSPINFVLGLMNIVGELAKALSLSFRLFGNLFAGEVLTAVMMFLAPFILPIPFTFLSMLTCVVQALVFASLATVYLGQAMGEEKEVAVVKNKK